MRNREYMIMQMTPNKLNQAFEHYSEGLMPFAPTIDMPSIKIAGTQHAVFLSRSTVPVDKLQSFFGGKDIIISDNLNKTRYKDLDRQVI
jgi:hypothetical protein